METKLIEIGNSKGVRLPQKLIQKYQLFNKIEIEEQNSGLFLRPIRSSASKLSWEDTYKQIRKENENWSDFDNSLADGLE